MIGPSVFRPLWRRRYDNALGRAEYAGRNYPLFFLFSMRAAMRARHSLATGSSLISARRFLNDPASAASPRHIAAAGHQSAQRGAVSRRTVFPQWHRRLGSSLNNSTSAPQELHLTTVESNDLLVALPGHLLSILHYRPGGTVTRYAVVVTVVVAVVVTDH